jgi:hypothetical protein
MIFKGVGNLEMKTGEFLAADYADCGCKWGSISFYEHRKY